MTMKNLSQTRPIRVPARKKTSDVLPGSCNANPTPRREQGAEKPAEAPESTDRTAQGEEGVGDPGIEEAAEPGLEGMEK